MVAEHGSAASQIIETLVPLVLEDIVKDVRSISQERIRQCIMEEIEEFADAGQGHSAFESQPSVSRADTSRTDAGVVTESELSAFESNPADDAGATWTRTFETQQLLLAYIMAAVTTGVILDITALVKSQFSITVVEASAQQVVGSLEEYATPVYNQVFQEQIVAGETTQNIVEIPAAHEKAIVQEIPKVHVVERIQEQIVETIRKIPQERMQRNTVEEIVDVPVPQIHAQVVKVVKIIPNEFRNVPWSKPSTFLCCRRQLKSTCRSVSSNRSSMCQRRR